jgi:hypothetical protein
MKRIMKCAMLTFICITQQRLCAMECLINIALKCAGIQCCKKALEEESKPEDGVTEEIIREAKKRQNQQLNKTNTSNNHQQNEHEDL